MGGLQRLPAGFFGLACRVLGRLAVSAPEGFLWGWLFTHTIGRRERFTHTIGWVAN